MEDGGMTKKEKEGELRYKEEVKEGERGPGYMWWGGG